MTITTEEITFVGGAGARLAGVLERPDEPRGAVLMAHCFTCSKDLHTMTRLGRGLAEAGYATLRFDFTGLGASGGSFTSSTLSTNIGDLTRAAIALIERGYGPCGLIGHSLGGQAVMLAAPKLKTVRSMAVIAAPYSPGHVKGLLADKELQIRKDGAAVVSIAGRAFPIGRELLDDLDSHDPARSIDELGRPLLVIHPVDDAVVPIAEGEMIFAAARQPKAFVPVLGTDHLLTARPAAERVLHHLVDWFDATL